MTVRKIYLNDCNIVINENSLKASVNEDFQLEADTFENLLENIIKVLKEKFNFSIIDIKKFYGIACTIVDEN